MSTIQHGGNSNTPAHRAKTPPYSCQTTNTPSNGTSPYIRARGKLRANRSIALSSSLRRSEAQTRLRNYFRVRKRKGLRASARAQDGLVGSAWDSKEYPTERRVPPHFRVARMSPADDPVTPEGVVLPGGISPVPNARHRIGRPRRLSPMLKKAAAENDDQYHDHQYPAQPAHQFCPVSWLLLA